MGSGCGLVGRAVASYTRGPRFESSHRQKNVYILNNCLLSTVYRKDENNEKEAGNGTFKKNNLPENKKSRHVLFLQNFVTPMRKLRKWLAANVNNNEKNTFQLKHNFY